MRTSSLLSAILLLTACSDAVDPSPGVPPGAIPVLSATPMGSGVALAWDSPADPDLAGTLVVRFPSTGVDATPEAGRVYGVGDFVGSGRAVFSGRGSTATDAEPCKAQVYAAWARDGEGNWSEGPTTFALSGLAGTLPAAPAALSATIENATVKLSWSPGVAPAPLYRVVRQPTLPATSPREGVPIFVGSGTSVVDVTADFSPSFSWHYVVYACNPCGECEGTGAKAAVTPVSASHAAPPVGLLQALRAGGLVVYWRHTTADTCADRQDLGSASSPQILDWWKSCERDCSRALARQLGNAGYADAEKIGRDVGAQGIPFSSVTASEYCRTLQTAERMALGPAIRTSKDITFFVYPEIDPCPAAEALFKKTPPAGSNTAYVGHLSVPCMSLDMGQAMVLRPDGRGGYTMIAKVLPSEWAGLT